MLYYKNKMLGSKFWLNSENLSFQEIQNLSHVNRKWTKQIFDNNKIIQPINEYVRNFIPFPDIVYDNNILTIRQKTHAEIWLEEIKNILYAVDKTQQRQFYPSKNNIINVKGYFDPTYRFYIPWTINKDITCKIKKVENSFFYIEEQYISFKEKNGDFYEPQWVDFLFKKTKNFIKDEYEIIKFGEPMFDIIINDKTTISEILNENK
jgi:hypothetical protein